MDIQEVYRLMERFEGAAIGELELEMSGTRIVLRKAVQSPVIVDTVQHAAAPAAEQIRVREEKKGESPAEIKAPLVGTFYRAASPEDQPYVTVGQSVKKGDVIGIIEAMKLMNEITAPQDGVVEEILVENETMVEYDQVLMTLK